MKDKEEKFGFDNIVSEIKWDQSARFFRSGKTKNDVRDGLDADLRDFLLETNDELLTILGYK